MKRLLVILFAVLLVGCAGSVQYVPLANLDAHSPGKSKIFVIRGKGFKGGGATSDIWVGDNLIAVLRAGDYVVWDQSEGPLTLYSRSGRGDNSLIMDVKGGQTYFAFIKMSGTFYGADFELIDPAEGRKLIEEYDRAAYEKW